MSWGSESIGVDDYIDYIGEISTLPEIVVGIIDTGVDLDHEFLQDRIIETGYNCSGTGINNSENDDHGHGTHVAGIVADNTTENVKVKAYKCLNSSGSGVLSNVVLAVYAAIDDNVNVINMSLGARKSVNTRAENSTMETAINEAIINGTVVCVAAGNNGGNAINYIPACIEDCITVGAIDAYDNEPYWSNWGEVVDIVAPGVSIDSTYCNGNYKSLSGTSMATPFVAAASAMLLCKNISYSYSDICSILILNGREWTTDNNCLLYGTPALYIGDLTNFTSKERTSAPTFNYESGKYSDGIYVEISSDDEAEIYYTLDGNRATNETGILYTEPIYIDKVTTIHAVAYAPNKLKSLQSFADYYITFTDDESNFTIDSEGVITAYTGNSKYLTIPNTVNGIVVTSIGVQVFAESDIVMIKFPDTLTTIYDSAFERCCDLESVDCNNLEFVGKYSFYDCESLTDIDLSQLECTDKYAFAFCWKIPYLNNDKLTQIADFAFTGWDAAISFNLPNVISIGEEGLSWAVELEHINIPKVEYLGYYSLSALAKIEEFNLPNLVEMDSRGGQFSSCLSLKKVIINNYTGAIGWYAFDGCTAIESVYIPNVTEIAEDAFYDCRKLNVLFAPNLEILQSLPKCNDINLYLSEKLNTINIKSGYSYKVIAPTGSYAEQWANENGYTFLSCDRKTGNIDSSNVTTMGRSICASVAGIRFGFTWDNIDEIESLASNVEYGFIYSQKGAEDLSIDTVDGSTIKKVLAPNRIESNGSTSFNLVISNIPIDYYNRDITARAYVCIDGMYFYSNTLKGSFGYVAGLVLLDDEIDQNTKNAVSRLLEA
ncbi:MAG: leucine-rich repeat protein [Eubacterium sp.]